MKCKLVILLILLILLISSVNLYPQLREYPLVSVPQAKDQGIPNGWILGGSNPHDYAAGVDLSESHSGFSSAFLKSIPPKPVGFVTLMQSFKANNYRSQRIKLSAYIKTRFVSGWSSLWMRINDASGQPLSFDDMRERPLLGSMEWTLVEIVLDVPPMSDEISLGFLLRGKGQMWVDDIKITMVDENEPVTDVLQKRSVNYSPKNLDFEE